MSAITTYNEPIDTVADGVLRIAPEIFYRIYGSTARRLILQGGQSAGKTVQTLIKLAVHATERSQTRITVTSESLPHLKGGAMKDFETLIYPYFESKIRQWNKTEHTFHFINGSYIEFKVFDSEMKARGPRRDYLYINEANGVDYQVYWQLDRRTKIQTIVDYNPSEKFWVHDKLVGAHGSEFFIFDHRHNPFLTADQHADIEGEMDDELFRVYARGYTGNVTGLIYPNWIRIPDSEAPDPDSYPASTGGLDFGYTTDPTVPIVTTKFRDGFFVKELAYAPGIDMKAVAEHFSSGGITTQPVYADHDKELISVLRRLGMNVLLAKKNIHSGILFVRKQKIYYPESSLNIHKERQRYVFLKSKETGEITNTPVDKFNHCMDSIRYSLYSHYAADS